MKSQRAISSTQPEHAAGRERQQLARRLLREASLELARLRRIRGAYRKTWRRVAGARARLAFAAAPIFASPLLIVDGQASPTFADLDAFVSGNVNGPTHIVFFENFELGPGTCADGLDNDFDGRIDSPSDPGCAAAGDSNERSSKQCDNGVDDDGDTKIDWRGDATGDPHCASLTDNNESPPPPPFGGCGIGPELLLLAPLLAVLRRGPGGRGGQRRRRVRQLAILPIGGVSSFGCHGRRLR